ncbi:class I lanthipeptide [Chryseobacterium sp. MYb264]|uniref:class I lanthipeptide n=1 Tax=Chryseobacterium sp. MYb264 TaxID=2745153 RepID=UPI002E114FB4|nr:class I lanthipeptide [Chryseobacterium sp. MYb264]
MKKKLKLNKKSITKLSNDNMKGIKGGKEAFLSIFNCQSKKCETIVDVPTPDYTFQYCPGPTTITLTCI